MAGQLACEFIDRRLLIQQPGVTVNGIDFVEVLDDDAPAGSPRQQTVLVRLFRPPAVPIATDRVRIEGGVRITPIGVRWVELATLVTAPEVSPAEAAFYAALPAADRTLVVRTDAAGDFSNYRLVIAPPAAGPTDVDPILSAVDLSFKAACPTQFDCAVVDACEPAADRSPRIDYLAKDYASFRRVMLDRLAAIAPAWRERNPGDVGVTIVELLAYAGDQLSYYQDAVATEAYLGTARQRISVRRHARLVGYAMHEGCNARAWVHVAVTADAVALRVADETRFLTRCGAPAAIQDTALAGLLAARRPPEVFEPLHDAVLYTAHNQIELYSWGQRGCCLPAGATRATLRDDPADRLKLRVGDVLILEEVKGVRTGRPVDADPTRRCAVRLTRVSPEATADGIDRIPGDLVTDPLTGVGVVEIEWHVDDALAHPMCISAADADGIPFDGVTVARGNIVLVDHGRSVGPEAIRPVPSAGARRYRPRRLRLTDLVHAVPYAHERATDRDVPWSARDALEQDPHAALPALVVDDPDGTWTTVPTLLASDRFDRHVVVELDDDRRAHVRFGDGALGRQPAPGVELAARYRVGAPRAGGVGAEAIGHVVTASTAIALVRNPLPATNGVEPETMREVRASAPYAFRTQERAVTEADYAEVARRHPDVQNAVATRQWTGSWYTMYVTIDRRGGRHVDAAFAAEMRAFIEPYRLAGHDVEVRPPVMVPLDIVLAVCVKRGYHAAHVHRALLERLSNRRLPGGALGLFHPDRLTFGREIYFSAVLDAAMHVHGVEWIDTTHPAARFQRWGEPSRGELDAGVIELGPLEIARLDNSANEPENGRLAIELLGDPA
jgi:hypothetical protein